MSNTVNVHKQNIFLCVPEFFCGLNTDNLLFIILCPSNGLSNGVFFVCLPTDLASGNFCGCVCVSETFKDPDSVCY